jgi:hypothetical protein
MTEAHDESIEDESEGNRLLAADIEHRSMFMEVSPVDEDKRRQRSQ